MKRRKERKVKKFQTVTFSQYAILFPFAPLITHGHGLYIYDGYKNLMS